EPERLLGSVVRRLHEWPVLGRGQIETTIADPAFAFLAASDLAEDSEQVKFAPSALSLEELSKLWSVFFQMPYVLSAAYQGTVVLIDGEEVPRPALPVRERRLEVAPFRRPVIEGVAAEAGPEAPVVAGSRLIIRGRHLRGESTRVRLAGHELEPIEVRDAEIVVDLAALAPETLRAGVLPLQVVHRRLLGAPPTPHTGPESNVTAVVLRPTLVAVNIEKTPTRKPPIPPPVAMVEIQPPVDADQRAALLLRGTVGDGGEGYTLSTPPRTEDGAVIELSLAGVEPGDYLASVQVDGAESPLEVDDDPESPTFRRFIGPKVTVP
ncbi:MAG: Pvc16 family protein, partial [Acidobacteriota bacterium]